MNRIGPTVNRISRRRLVGVGAAATLLGLRPTQQRRAAAQDGNATIVLVPGQTGDNFFYIPMACGAQAAADALGATLEVDGSPDWDPMLQAKVLAEIVARQPDAILIVPTDKQAMIAPIQAAIDAGIAVFTLDTAVDADIALATIASDNVEGGRIGARALAEAIGEKGKVFVINTDRGISSTDEREQGFAMEIASYPEIEYLGQEFGENDPDLSAQIVSAKLQEVPGLVGIFATNLPGGLGAGDAVAAAGAADRVKVVAFDAGPDQVAQLEAGSVVALIAQHPYDMGELGVRMAVEYLETGQRPPEPFLGTGFSVVTRENHTELEIVRHLYALDCAEMPVASPVTG